MAWKPQPVGWSRDRVAELIAAAPAPVLRCPETARSPAGVRDAPAGKPEIDFGRLSSLDRLMSYQQLRRRWLRELPGSQYAVLVTLPDLSLGFGRTAVALTNGRLAEEAGCRTRPCGGRHAGRSFWGCSRYPGCTGTRPIQEGA